MSATRQAFDLFHPACRKAFRRALRFYWKRPYWWRMVFSDTVNRVCSKTR